MVRRAILDGQHSTRWVAPLVTKPSPDTVLDSLLLAEAAEEAGVPAGVLNIVPAGREVGAYLVCHSGVDKVAFTGSTAVGGGRTGPAGS